MLLPPPTDPTRFENSVEEYFFLVGFENFCGVWKILMGYQNCAIGTICNDRRSLLLPAGGAVSPPVGPGQGPGGGPGGKAPLKLLAFCILYKEKFDEN